MYTITLCLGFAALTAIGQSAPMLAPLIPDEFTANMMQIKWGMNDPLDNTTTSSMYYNSVANSMIRQDIVVNAGNATSVLPVLGISLIDFSVCMYFEARCLMHVYMCNLMHVCRLDCYNCTPSSTIWRNLLRHRTTDTPRAC
jgi:hypothetical protein